MTEQQPDLSQQEIRERVLALDRQILEKERELRELKVQRDALERGIEEVPFGKPEGA